MLSTLVIEKIAKKHGAKRVSKNAIKELKHMAEELASDIALKAIKISQHSNRLTVMGKDVRFCVGEEGGKE